MGLTTTYEYDSRDRLTTVTAPSGAKSVTEYDAIGRRAASIDPLGRKTRYAYDSRNRLVNVIANDDTMTTNVYDDAGRMVQFIDQRGNSWRYTFDKESRLIAETTPLDEVTSYIYGTGTGCGSCGGGGHSAGHLHQTIDPAGRSTYHTYDSMGRITKTTFSGSSDEVTYAYDAAGRRTSVTDTRLPASLLGGQTYSYAYDILDRLTTETYPGGKSVAYRFDTLGRRTHLVDPFGRETVYTYSNTADNKKLSSISHPLGGTTSLDYDSGTGLLFEENMANGTQNSWGYDAHLRVASLGARDASTNDIVREAYTYDAAGVRTRVDVSSDQPGAQAYHKLFTYDLVGLLKVQHKRLTASNSTSWRHSYTYDAAGNRLTHTEYDGSTTYIREMEYNAANQLTSRMGDAAGDGFFSYDSNGNMLTWASGAMLEGPMYTFNQQNQLARVEQFDGDGITADVAYSYDPMGRRILRSNNSTGERTRYYYDGLAILATQQLPNGSNTWREGDSYTLSSSQLAHILSRHTPVSWGSGATSHTATARAFTYYHYDLLGNVIAESDAYGEAATIVDMEAFGTVQNGGQDGFRFTTKQYDPDAKLYYFNARWYDPNVGLLSIDLLSKSQFTYSMSRQNPLKYVDVNGLQAISDEDSHRLNRSYAGGDGYSAGPTQFTDLLNGPVICGVPAVYQFSRELRNWVGNNMGKGGGDSGKQADMLRHCLWMCILTKKCGADTAKSWGDNNEFARAVSGTIKGNDDVDDRAVDYYNNDRGIEYGLRCGPPEDCYSSCRNAARNGNLAKP